MEVAIVSDYKNKNNLPEFKSLDQRINEKLKEHPKKDFVDVKYIDNNRAMLIMKK